MKRYSRHRKPLQTAPQTAEITALSHDGRGITHINGKITFIDNALPGEKVVFHYTLCRGKYDEGRATEIIIASPERVTPACQHFAICGGCALQHMNKATQLNLKQQMFLEQLQHFGKIQPQQILAPLTSAEWGYRRKARLGAKFVIKKQAVLVGFREKNGRYLADLNRCEVLHPSVGHAIPALKKLIAGLAAFQHIPQIEVAVGDNVTALVFRHMVDLSQTDKEQLIAFGKTHQFNIYVQPNKPLPMELIYCQQEKLHYSLPEYSVTLEFDPTGFIQVNADLNQQMVKRVIELLAPNENDRILDLFCGLGNFTLPLARFGKEIIGIEGDAELIQLAQKNAAANKIGNAHFYQADLTTDFTHSSWAKQPFDKILLDPPRTGALETIPQIVKFNAKRIVYVSCNPATFARDAGELINHGYQLTQTGIMDMFPHTQHVEAIGLFEKNV